jgi:protein TonB
MQAFTMRPLPAAVSIRLLSRTRGTALVALLVMLLAACSGDAPQQAPAAPQAAGGAPAEQPAPQPAANTAADAAARGEQALRDQRLFLPAADNAFEYFLAAVEANPADERSHLALQDLVPYAVLHVEQRLAAEDVEDAARVLALLQRAAGEAPALPRLQAQLDSVQARQASARAAAEAAALRAATAPVQPDVAVPAPPSAPAAISDPPAAVPSSAAAQTSPPQPTPAPPVAAAESAAPAPARVAAPAARVPEVVFRPALRYPSIAERRKLEGFVEIEFTIGADGGVSELEVLRSEPEGVFEREALAAMERWRFAPPAAPMRARRTLEFKLAR